jgi:filamentous hemagglutinin family protein
MRGTKLLGCTAVALLAAGVPASADVVRDGSLGTGTIAAGMDSDGLEATYVITEKHGKFAGPNLFHSLSEFDVGGAEIASFTLTSDCAGCSVDNIIAGVSGGPSDIDGKIRTSSDLAGAALFLLNPAGIFFGPGAELDVKGSFHASTADVLRFTEGADFDVFDTSPDRILNSAPPSAFGFTGPDLSDFGPNATSTASSAITARPPASGNEIRASTRIARRCAAA